MRLRLFLVSSPILLIATVSQAQQPLLVDPAKAPVRLTGGWQTPDKRFSGEVNVYVDRLNPDGSFTGKLDFLGGRNCKAMGEPIKEGRITADEIRVVANGGPPNICGDLTLVFKRGTSKFLEGTTSSQQGSGNPMWLDAPK